MKSIRKIFLPALFLISLGLGLGSCVGYVDERPGYYGHGHGYYGRDPWFNDGPWMDGPRGYIGIGIGVHPVRGRHR